MSTRQGSASYVIVIGGVTAVAVGALMLTFVMYPLFNAFSGSPLFTAETAYGATLITYTLGLWEFWGGILLIALIAWIWVVTRQ
jgi:hypothetical protein